MNNLCGTFLLIERLRYQEEGAASLTLKSSRLHRPLQHALPISLSKKHRRRVAADRNHTSMRDSTRRLFLWSYSGSSGIGPIETL